VDGTAVFTGAPGEVNDAQMVPPFEAPATLKITDAGAALTAGAGCTQIDAHSAYCAETGHLPLNVATGDMNDNVHLSDYYSRKISVVGGARGRQAVRQQPERHPGAHRRWPGQRRHHRQPAARRRAGAAWRHG
jgi:hypothetical protein